jgi:hypothetical protein
MSHREIRLSNWGWLVLVVAFTGCGGSEQSSPAGRDGKMVYVDTVTKEAMVMEIAESFPAAQPGTGKRTLMPGMYCTRCQEWHPIPPPDQINRTPRATVCRKTGAPLTTDGPWPEEGQSP